MEALTYDRAVELAREVVAEFGEDYVYPQDHKVAESPSSVPSCVYVHDGKPSCLVGQILYRHGVDLDDLATQEFTGAWIVAGKFAAANLKTCYFLDAMQSLQDKGSTWGEALGSSLNLTEEYYVNEN